MPSVDLTPTESVITVLDTRLFYAEFGVGQPIVWLHGSGPGASGLSNFGGNLPAFAGYRNIVFDLPRFGRSDKPQIDGPGIPFSAERIIAAMDALGIAGAHMVGNSFGGGVALSVAATRPELVKRLVLMGSAGAVAPPGTPPAQVSDGMRMVRRYFDTPEPNREQLREVLEMMVSDASLITEELLSTRHAASLAAHPEMPPTPPADLRWTLGKITVPTLLLWGRDDRVIPADRALPLLQNITDSMLVVLPRCGHWVQVEHRERFNELVSRFLKGDL